MDKKKRCLWYSTYMSSGDKGYWKVYLCYPDPKFHWDEWKWTKEEALAKYPKSEWEWIKLKGD